MSNFENITEIIDAPKSGEKGKLAFLDLDGDKCSTEDYFKSYYTKDGWTVLRAEVNLWQQLYCLTFWDAIFFNHTLPTIEQRDSGEFITLQLQDIPLDLFSENFFTERDNIFNEIYENLIVSNLSDYINSQIEVNKDYWTRLIYNHPNDSFDNFNDPVFQDFLKVVPNKLFSDIVFKIARNLNENRAGVPDFIVWKDNNLFLIEVKKLKEKINEKQEKWLNWFIDNNYPIKIVRLNPIDSGGVF